MEIRAYAHPYKHIDLMDVQAWDEARVGRQPVALLYHVAADLDDQARAIERDVDTLWYGMEVRTELIALHASLGLYPDRLAALREEQRIDRSNWGLGCRMLKEYEAQQARIQWLIIQKDPRRYSTYEG